MFNLFWLCVLPVAAGIAEIWHEQLLWHHQYSAAHLLFAQARQEKENHVRTAHNDPVD